MNHPSRYVLPDEAPYLKNMAALWSVDPALAAAIEALHPQTGYAVAASKSGAPTVSIATPDGRMVSLHSRHKPVDEGKRLADSVDVAANVFFYIFGFGLGYHVESIFDRASDEAVFCVFEPDLRLLQTAFEHRDLSRLIESRRFMFFTRADKGDVLARLTPQSALIAVGAQHVVHPPSMDVVGEFHRQIQTLLEEFGSFSRTSLNTVVLNSRRTAENLSRNLAWYSAAPGVSRLAGRHRGEPAVIVSAGPSLRKNKHLLKGLESNAVLIAVQTVLQPLIEMGVEPRYVTSLDYHDVSRQFYEKLPKRINTELVAEPKAASAILRMYPGPVSLLGNRFAESMLRELKVGKPEMTGGATVAHLAFYLAEHLGCDPIIFVGQDLGFSDGLFYSPGTSYEDVWRPEFGRFCSVEMKQWEQIVRERHILRKIPDYLGRPMYTEERMYTYLQQFERDFLRSKSKVIDATEGGAAKRGTTTMPFAEAISQYCKSPIRDVPTDHPGLDWGRVGQCLDSLRKRREEADGVEKISRQTLPLLEEIRDHIDDQSRVNRAIGEIDGLRARMNAFGATYDLITELTQSSQLDRFNADRRLSAAKVEGIEKQRRQIARDVENVRGVMLAAKDFEQMVSNVIEAIAVEHEAGTRQNRAA
ncbi:MAG TPA: 6-hydroxymethylpterin diphosphokinase MptE-like protein [Tepidisphaeraceae bacterium]